MENRIIKDCQLDLFANRMRAHAYKANQLRLLLAAFAYVLIDGIRRVALKKTTLAKAVPNTIRRKILKLGAKVINSVRRIKLSLPSPARVRLAKAWWSEDAWRCPELPHNPFRGHSEIHIGRCCQEVKTPLRYCLSGVLFGCGGAQPPRPTFSDYLDLIRCNFLILRKVSRCDAVLSARVRWESRASITGATTT